MMLKSLKLKESVVDVYRVSLSVMLWQVVDPAGARNSVAHTRRLVHFVALDEELEVAVDVAALVQGKIVR